MNLHCLNYEDMSFVPIIPNILIMLVCKLVKCPCNPPKPIHTRTRTRTHTHTHTHTHTWSSGQSTLRCTGSSWGFGALLKDLTSVVDNSCRSREPTTSDYKSSALSIRPRLPLDYNLQLYFKLLHIQCRSVKSNAILIKIHKHIKSYSFASEIP